jgi:3-oxoacyl-[acyl-carrier protein] reductase
LKIDLTGKNALIGGSSKGIGLAIAKRLASSGANVTLMARNGNLLKKIVRELDQGKGQLHQSFVIDFSDYGTFSQKIYSFFKKNKIDILVNNTQGPPPGKALEKNINEYQTAFDLLFKCAIYTTSLAIPHMKSQGWGRVINVSSISVKSLSVDVAEFNITINNVLTGFFDTERLEQLHSSKAKLQGKKLSEINNEIKALIPMKRFGKVEEYASLVCFLSSDLSGYITGTSIPIDGGVLKSL